MKREDQVSYVMLFCALLLVRNSRATLNQCLTVLPLSTRVGCLSRAIVEES